MKHETDTSQIYPFCQLILQFTIHFGTIADLNNIQERGNTNKVPFNIIL